MSFLEKIKIWFNKKTYFSIRDAETFEEKDCRLLSNSDFFNIFVAFFIISFSLGIFLSTIYFRCYIDPSYQEEKNKLMIKELYKDLDRIKKNNKQRNNFLISLQNLINDKDDFSAELGVKSYNIKSFYLPVENKEIVLDSEDSSTLKAKVKKENKILATNNGIIIFENRNRDDCFLILQHENSSVSVYNFVGKNLKDVGEAVRIGETIGEVTKNSEMYLQIFCCGEKINLENIFIN